MSSGSPKSITDTVVLLYFLLVDEWELLLSLLDTPILLPRIVFDPDEGVEGDVPEVAKAEISRSIDFYRRVGDDPARDRSAREQGLICAQRLSRIYAIYAAGDLAVVDLDNEELGLLSRLTSPHLCHEFELAFPLDPGEAACLALAVRRGLVLGTDDSDALKALKVIASDHPYERIRKLLIRAAREERISQERANAIHAEMRKLGFWDRHPPFP